jgi:hypothetical protein
MGTMSEAFQPELRQPADDRVALVRLELEVATNYRLAMMAI